MVTPIQTYWVNTWTAQRAGAFTDRVIGLSPIVTSSKETVEDRSLPLLPLWRVFSLGRWA